MNPLLTPEPPWRHYLLGGGQAIPDPDGKLRLQISATSRQQYRDAQLDDYQAGVTQPLLHQPPLRLQITARFSHPAGRLRGTAGFGLWNYPSAWPPRPPQAIWFFYGSSPGDLPLALGVPGNNGWKAATIDLQRGLGLLPFGPLLAPVMRIPWLQRAFWPPIQRAIGVAEVAVPVAMDAWHTYQIEWGPQTSRFLVDGRVILSDAPSPRGPLCVVAWVDNQYLIATPQGRLGWGLLDLPEAQTLDLAEVSLDPLPA
ncbi:MAG: hypothetical protein AB4911_20190 [Oscillochloridaceae bacterium umkhey_bin13]